MDTKGPKLSNYNLIVIKKPICKGEVMRIRIGSPFLLTIISIFSILFFATSIAAQQASDMSTMGNSSGMPPMGNSSGMPPVGGQSPAQNALALAQAAKLAADQQVNTAQGTLESAQSAVQTAQQTLTTAQETLVSATSALQEAEDAVEKENQQKDELIRVAKQAVREAEQNLQTAQQELDSARSALQELEQQIATAQGTVTTAEGKQRMQLKAVNDARAKLAQLMGNNSGMPPINAGGPI
jgi:multidrug efflux pump subunit AcrA (membrane-fusion protein)